MHIKELTVGFWIFFDPLLDFERSSNGISLIPRNNRDNCLMMVVLLVLSMPALSRFVLLVVWGVFATSIFSLQMPLGESPFKWHLFGVFLLVRPETINFLMVQWSRFKIFAISNVDLPLPKIDVIFNRSTSVRSPFLTIYVSSIGASIMELHTFTQAFVVSQAYHCLQISV